MTFRLMTEPEMAPQSPIIRLMTSVRSSLTVAPGVIAVLMKNATQTRAKTPVAKIPNHIQILPRILPISLWGAFSRFRSMKYMQSIPTAVMANQRKFHTGPPAYFHRK